MFGVNFPNNSISAPSGQPFTPVQATYSDKGREIAESSVIYDSRADVSYSESDAVHLKNLIAIGKDPTTTDAEKLLAQFGKNIGKAETDETRCSQIRNALMKVIASQVPGPLSTILPSINLRIFNSSNMPWDSGRRVLRTGLTEIIDSPAFSPDAKDLARLGLSFDKKIFDNRIVGISNSHIMSAIRADKPVPITRKVAEFCATVTDRSDFEPCSRNAVIGAGLDLIKNHPSASKNEAALAEFGCALPETMESEKLTCSARTEIALRIANGTSRPLAVEIADVYRTISSKHAVDWSSNSDLLKPGFKTILSEKSTSPENQILAELGMTVLDSGCSSKAKVLFCKNLYKEIALQSSKNIADCMYKVCSETVNNTGITPENGRRLLTGCFKTLRNHEASPDMEGLHNLIDKGYDLGFSGMNSFETLDKIQESRNQQMEVLKTVSELYGTKRKLSDMLDAAQKGLQAPSAGIQTKAGEVDVGGITLRRKKRWLNSAKQ